MPGAEKCFLRCCKGLHPDILLAHQVKITVGRGPNTKIKDKRCSRDQISLVADYKKLEVRLTQLGLNVGKFQDKELSKGQAVNLRHGDTFDILSGEYQHKIFFDPAPSKENMNTEPESESAETPAKRKTTPPSPEASKAKQPKLETKKSEVQIKKLDRSSGNILWEEGAGGQIYIMTYGDCKPSEKIASFDMDNTLIATASGRVFPLDHNDWKIFLSEVPGKLKSYHEDGYKIVVITNQAGVAKGKVKIEDFQTKVERIAEKIGVPMQLWAITSEGIFRKPRIGMWNCLRDQKNEGVPINMEQSFYCGDAAGRNKDWLPGRKKDFSCSDRLFALNLDLAFFTPEELFLKQKATKKFTLPEFDPKSIKKDTPLLEPATAVAIAKRQEVVLMVGIQGSGKSHMAETVFEKKGGYFVASNDRSGGRDKTLRLLEAALKRGESVVVDNTHADKASRKKYLDVVSQFKSSLPVRCFIMTGTPQQARHNNIFRELIGLDHVKIKEPLFNAFKSRYQEPTLDEGFDEIVHVNFVPNFRNEQEEELYKMYLQEK